MKHILSILIAGLIFSCSNNPNPPISIVKRKETPPNKQTGLINSSTTMDTASTKQAFDFDYIKSVSSGFTPHFNIDSINFHQLTNIPKEFIEQYITPNPAANSGNEILYADYPEAFKFYQTKEFKSFDLFTFIYADETCCRFLYGVTTEKERLEIKNVFILGFSGGDAGWQGNKYGTWHSDSVLHLIRASSYDPDLENGPNTEIDSVWETLQLSTSGQFTSLITDSVSYFGTVKK